MLIDTVYKMFYLSRKEWENNYTLQSVIRYDEFELTRIERGEIQVYKQRESPIETIKVVAKYPFSEHSQMKNEISIRRHLGRDYDCLCLPFGIFGEEENNPDGVLYQNYDWDLSKLWLYWNYKIYSGGSRPFLPEYLQSGSKCLTTELIKHIFMSLLKAILILEEHHIIHHDIIGRNIFLSFSNDIDHPSVVLGDFGVSEILREENHYIGQEKNRSFGSQTCPEKVNLNIKQDMTSNINIWELGNILLQLLRVNRSAEQLMIDIDQSKDLYVLYIIMNKCREDDQKKRLSAAHLSRIMTHLQWEN